jgi:polar amino acid transport system substrate-binding protein
MILLKKWAIATMSTLSAAITIAMLLQISSAAIAETLLQKIERTGELNAGAPQDSMPFGFVGKDGKTQGYSVDLIRLIQRRLEAKFNIPIKLNLQEANVDNRFKIIEKGEVDLMCGSTTITQERLERVDFSVPFFITGAQLLVKLSQIKQVDVNSTLKNIAIAFIPDTTTDQILRQIYPAAQWVPVKTRQAGLAKLNEGKVKAVASDGILLIGEVVGGGFDPAKYAITPRQPITTELYGCILPKNNPEWKEFVDTIIVSPENVKIQDQWFNLDQGLFPYLRPK